MPSLQRARKRFPIGKTVTIVDTRDGKRRLATVRAYAKEVGRMTATTGVIVHFEDGHKQEVPFNMINW